MIAISYAQPAWRCVVLMLATLLSACGGSSSGSDTTDCAAGQVYDSQLGRCVASNTAPQITSATSLSLAAEQTNGSVVYTATATDAQNDAIS